MSIRDFGSPATYCQPAAAAGFIYCRSQEWALHSPSPAGFVYLEFSCMLAPFFSPNTALPACCNCSPFLFRVHVQKCSSPTLPWSLPYFSCCWTPSPLQAHPPSLAGFCIYSSYEEVPCPPFPVELSTWQPIRSFPRSKVAGQRPPLLPSLAGLLIYNLCEGVPLPHSLELREPCPLCYVSFFFSCLFIIQFAFFIFPWEGVSLSRVLFWFVPGSTTYCLYAHLAVFISQAC
jgi:hypothetical protein